MVVCIFSGLLSFFLLFSYEKYAPVGPSWRLMMLDGDSSGQVPVATVNRAIASYGRAHKVDVARRVADPDTPQTVSHLYVVASSGDSFAKRWEGDGYQSFNPSMAYRIHSEGQSLDTSPSGEYFVSGTETDVLGLVKLLNGFGFTDAGFQSTSKPNVMFGLLSTGGFSVLAAPLTVLVLLVALVAVGVASNDRGYAIQRLQGRGRGGALLLDASAMGRFYLELLGVLGVLSGIAIFFYNRWHHFGVLLLLWALFAVVGVALAAAVHTLTLFVVWRFPLQQALKGASSSRGMLVSTYLVRIFSLLMVFVVSALALNDAVALAKAQQRYGQWEGATRLGKITLGGGTFSADGQSDMRKSADRIGAWEKALNKRGELLLAVTNPGSGTSDNKDLTLHGQPYDVLYVNETYLGLQKVTDTEGKQVHAPKDAAGVTVIIPKAYADETRTVTEAIDTDMKSRASGDDGKPTVVPRIDVDIAPDGQDRFTYNAADFNPFYQPESMPKDPVMVILPNDSPFMSSDDYYGYTTWGSILVMDTREAIKDAKAQPQLTRDVISISPAVQEVAAGLSNAYLGLTTSVLNLLIGLTAALVTTLGMAVTYTQRRAQFIFAARISGWRYPTMFKRLFILDAVLTTLIVAGSSVGLWAILGAFSTSGSAASRTIDLLHAIIPVAGVLVAVGAVGVLVGAVVWCSNRIIAARSADVA